MSVNIEKEKVIEKTYTVYSVRTRLGIRSTRDPKEAAVDYLNGRLRELACCRGAMEDDFRALSFQLLVKDKWPELEREIVDLDQWLIEEESGE